MSADEFTLTCGRDIDFGGFRAVAVARFDEYVLSLNVTIDQDMSFERFRQLISFLDGMMNSRLSSQR